MSPSNAHPLIVAAEPNVNVLKDVVSLPMFRYRLVLVDWMLPEMLKYSDVASGPMTARDAMQLTHSDFVRLHTCKICRRGEIGGGGEGRLPFPG